MTVHFSKTSRSAQNDTAVGSRCRAVDLRLAKHDANQRARSGWPITMHHAAINHGPARQGSAHRGSALLLTLVCLVMMVLLGTAYVQVARVDRRATAQIVGVDNMSTVRDAVLQYIAEVLQKDIIGPGSDPDSIADDMFLFNDSASDNSHLQNGSGAAFVNGSVGDGDIIEDFDYPFTNRNVSYEVTKADGTVLGVRAMGGAQDDTWLASAHIDNSTSAANKAYARFAHISNLNGLYLRIPKSGNPDRLPLELPTTDELTTTPPDSETTDGLGGSLATINHGVRVAGHTGTDYISLNDSESIDNDFSSLYRRQGVDADLDGISDSSETWAPEHVRQIGAEAFTVSYRIIDTSSMLNLNVATAYHETNASNVNVGDDASATYGLYPSDLNLTRMVKQMDVKAHLKTAPDWRNELRDLLTHRGVIPDAVNVPLIWPGQLDLAKSPLESGHDFDSTNDQLTAWYGSGTSVPWGAKYYGYENNKFGVASEMRLRGKGGVVPSADSSPLEGVLPQLLREGKIEKNYRDVPNISYQRPGVSLSSNGQIASNFSSGACLNLDNNGIYSATVYPSLRNMFTVYSGAVDFAPRVLHTSATPSTYMGDDADDIYKVDLVHRYVTSPSANPELRLRMIKERLYKVLTVGDKNYLNLSNADAEMLAIRWALNIVDYSDTDHDPSVWPDPISVDGEQVQLHGLEMMPYLKEVYFQAGYKQKDLKMEMDDGMGNITLVAGTDMKWDTLEKEDGSRGLIVEVGNPYDREIDMTNNRFSVVLMQGITKQVEFNLGGKLPAFNPEDMATGQSTKIYVMEPTTGVTEGGLGANLTNDIVATDLEVTSGPAVAAVPLFGDLDDIVHDEPIVVALRVQVDGNPVVYDQMVIDDFKFPEKYELTTQDTNATAEYRFFQYSARRAGEKAGATAEAPPTIGYFSNYGLSTNRGIRQADDDSMGFRRGSAGDDFEKIGIVDKQVTFDPKLEMAKLYIRIPNRRILNVAELGYIFSGGGFSTLSSSSLKLDRSLADTLFGSAGNGLDTGGVTDLPFVSDPDKWLHMFYLSFPSSALPGGLDVPTDLKVPHAAYLFDNFTCISSGWDGLDTSNTDEDANEGTLSALEDASAAGAHEAEHFIAGRLNVNTAPFHVLVASSPLPETRYLPPGNVAIGTSTNKPFADRLFRGVRRFRDSPWERDTYGGFTNPYAGTGNPYSNGTSVNNTSDYGLVAIGQAMLLRENEDDFTTELNAETSVAEAHAESAYLYASSKSNIAVIPANDVRKIYPSRYAFEQVDSSDPNNYLSSTPATGYNETADGPWPVTRNHKYREQDRMVRFHFINPTLTTRSDTFCAYFEIRAYNAADYSVGFRSAKAYMALYDRSNVKTTDDITEIVNWKEQ